MRKKEEELPRQFQSYSPNRFEYFAGKALQGLVTGKAERDLNRVVYMAIELGKEMERAVDS